MPANTEEAVRLVTDTENAGDGLTFVANRALPIIYFSYLLDGLPTQRQNPWSDMLSES